jgi:hypothetical protein
MTNRETAAFYPAVYYSADQLSNTAQRHFLMALGAHLSLLVVGAALPLLAPHNWIGALSQMLAFAGALSCAIYLAAMKPDRLWYAARALAESMKTICWRFVVRAEPFDSGHDDDRGHLIETMRKLIEQNKRAAQKMSERLDGRQITAEMMALRHASLAARRDAYIQRRIDEQRRWYAGKSKFNRRRAVSYFGTLIALNLAALTSAALRMRFVEAEAWPTDILVAASVGVMGWMQTKKYSELAASYALAAHEIGFIREQAASVHDELLFSLFVGDAENAFSREHTQWIARKDEG